MRRHVKKFLFASAVVIAYNVGFVVGGVQTKKRLKNEK